MLLDDIKQNNELSELLKNQPEYPVLVFSNVILHQLRDPLEIRLKKRGINARVSFGDYDNIVQESSNKPEKGAVIVCWEAAAFTEGLYYKSGSFTDSEIEQLKEKILAELNLVINNLKNTPLVIFNLFHNHFFKGYVNLQNDLNTLISEVNLYLQKNAPKNFVLFDPVHVLTETGIKGAFNKRMWYSSKMLYSYDYLTEYASQIAPLILAVNGKTRKVLVLDCDNTLWKGIIGEDGIEGISINSAKPEGVYFEQVHYYIKSLMKKGIVLALNSKNNENDVKQVFEKYTELPLKWDDFLVKKVNWQDKATNIKEIAKEINVGTDAIVHMDDSDFELNFIQQELPATGILKVPSEAREYPEFFRKNISAFYQGNITAEDLKRNEMYREEQNRQAEAASFEHIDDYLKSLKLSLNIRKNKTEDIERLAQMTQKTNQFNVTTPRYTDAEITQKMQDGKHWIFSFGLKDKFGDYGTTGLAIVNFQNHQTVYFDAFLMSCRIIGRKAENAFFSFLANQLKTSGVTKIVAEYKPTYKNSQVAQLFDNFGFELKSENESGKQYELLLSQYFPAEVDFIQINYEGEN